VLRRDQEKRREYNKRYYEKTKYARENKEVQTRLRKVGPARWHRRLEVIWATATLEHEQELGEFSLGLLWHILKLQQSAIPIHCVYLPD
jgi:hypothetical protein